MLFCTKSPSSTAVPRQRLLTKSISLLGVLYQSDSDYSVKGIICYIAIDEKRGAEVECGRTINEFVWRMMNVHICTLFFASKLVAVLLYHLILGSIGILKQAEISFSRNLPLNRLKLCLIN